MAVSTVPWAVIMFGSFSELIFFACRSTSSPSMSGRRRSMMARWMDVSRILCKPASPFSATQISWPCRARIFRQVSHISGSSSTTRTRAVSIATDSAAAMSVALQWKHNAECRTHARGTTHAYFPSVIANDAIADRQAQPGSSARRLGREKRIEYPGLVFLGNSLSRIRDVYDYLAPTVGEADA